MRFKSRGALLALMTTLAVLATTAIGASAALASAPVFKYTGTGTKAKDFAGTGGSISFEQTDKSEWQCAESEITGEINGASGSQRVTHTFVTYSECESAGKYITTKGEPAGVVKTTELEGELGVVGGGESHTAVIGLLLKAKGTEPIFTSRDGTVTIELKGSLIGSISPVNTKVGTTKGFTLTYEQSRGEERIRKFEGGIENRLEMSFGYLYQAGVSGELSVKPLEGEMEIVH